MANATTTQDDLLPPTAVGVKRAPVFRAPMFPPDKPPTQAPIEMIEQAPDCPCIHFKDIPDLVREYGEHFDIQVNDDEILLLTRRIHPTNDDAEDSPDYDEIGTGCYRSGTPERECDNDDVVESSEKKPLNTTNETDFDILTSTFSPTDLNDFASQLESCHKYVQNKLKDATEAAHDAAASLLAMKARLENKRRDMGKSMATVWEIFRKLNDDDPSDEDGEENDGEEASNIPEKQDKGKGKDRATERTIPSTSGRQRTRQSSTPGQLHYPTDDSSPLCVGRDLTVSLDTEHYPLVSGTPNQNVPRSLTRKDPTSVTPPRDSATSSRGSTTILFGLASKGNPTSPSKFVEPNPPDIPLPQSLGKKRTRDETEDQQDDTGTPTQPNLDPLRSSPKRPRRDDSPAPSTRNTGSRKRIPLKRCLAISDLNDPEEVARADRLQKSMSSSPQRNPLRRSPAIQDLNDSEEVARAEILRESMSSPQRTPLKRSPAVLDLNDAEDVARAEMLRESMSSPQRNPQDAPVGTSQNLYEMLWGAGNARPNLSPRTSTNRRSVRLQKQDSSSGKANVVGQSPVSPPPSEVSSSSNKRRPREEDDGEDQERKKKLRSDGTSSDAAAPRMDTQEPSMSSTVRRRPNDKKGDKAAPKSILRSQTSRRRRSDDPGDTVTVDRDNDLDMSKEEDRCSKEKIIDDDLVVPDNKESSEGSGTNRKSDNN